MSHKEVQQDFAVRRMLGKQQYSNYSYTERQAGTVKEKQGVHKNLTGWKSKSNVGFL